MTDDFYKKSRILRYFFCICLQKKKKMEKNTDLLRIFFVYRKCSTCIVEPKTVQFNIKKK